MGLCQEMRVEENGMLIFSGYRVSILQNENLVEIVAVAQSLSHLRLFVTPWTAAHQAFLSFTISLSLLKLYVYWVDDAIQPSHPLSPASPPAFSLSLQQSFSVSWPFTSGDQSIGASASASVLAINIQGWFPLGLTGLISLQSKGLSRVFSSTTVQNH